MTFRYTHNGGMRFLRIGRLQMSWSIVKHPPKPLRLRKAWRVS